MARKITALCLGVGLAFGLGAALQAPAVAAPIPAVQFDTAHANPLLHKVHRRHCRSRWDKRRGWHRHWRACRRHGRRHYRHYGWRGWRRHHRDGCWFHPRYGLRCQF